MLKWLNTDTAQGVIRAGLSFGGGILVGKGLLTPEQLSTFSQQVTSPEFIGSATAVITAVWSVIHKQQLAATTPTTK